MKAKKPENQVEVPSQITVREAGRRGGIATRDRRGVEFLREIAKKGGEVTKTRYGHLFSEFGKRGGRPRRPSLEDSGKGLPEKKGDERSAPESPLPPNFYRGGAPAS